MTSKWKKRFTSLLTWTKPKGLFGNITIAILLLMVIVTAVILGVYHLGLFSGIYAVIAVYMFSTLESVVRKIEHLWKYKEFMTFEEYYKIHHSKFYYSETDAYEIFLKVLSSAQTTLNLPDALIDNFRRTCNKRELITAFCEKYQFNFTFNKIKTSRYNFIHIVVSITIEVMYRVEQYRRGLLD